MLLVNVASRQLTLCTECTDQLVTLTGAQLIDVSSEVDYRLWQIGVMTHDETAAEDVEPQLARLSTVDDSGQLLLRMPKCGLVH